MQQPTHEEISVAAYYRWKRRGEAHGHDQFDWYEARHDVIVAKNYTIIAHHQLSGVPKQWPRRARRRAARG